MRFTVRPMVLEDIPQVHALDQASFSMPWPASAYRFELLENPGSAALVAEVVAHYQKEIIGMLVMWLIVDEAHIATIAVQEELRQQGIGARLLVEALKIAALKGMVSVTLEVREGNAAARSLYERFKFEVVGRRPRYYRDNQEDALIMTLANLDSAYLEWLENSQESAAGDEE